MTRTTCHLSLSFDGYLAGPDPTRAEPLGVGGERLHELTPDERDPVEMAGGGTFSFVTAGFDGVADPGLTQLEVTSSPRVTHSRYRVER